MQCGYLGLISKFARGRYLQAKQRKGEMIFQNTSLGETMLPSKNEERDGDLDLTQ